MVRYFMSDKESVDQKKKQIAICEQIYQLLEQLRNEGRPMIKDYAGTIDEDPEGLRNAFGDTANRLKGEIDELE